MNPIGPPSRRRRGGWICGKERSLLVKVGEEFVLLVLSADRKLDSSAVRRHSGTRRLRFATREELRELTGLEPGSVPPFGEPVLPLRVYVDPSVLERDEIAFNAGSLTDSMFVNAEEYREEARPEVFRFAAKA